MNSKAANNATTKAITLRFGDLITGRLLVGYDAPLQPVTQPGHHQGIGILARTLAFLQ